MKRLSVIEIEKNTKGVFPTLQIDLIKHADDNDIVIFLTKNGISTKALDDYITKIEVKKQTNKFISTLKWDK